MKQFLLKMLSSSNGNISSKRVIGFAGFIFLTGSMLVSIFSKREITPAPELVDAVTYITMAALFGNTVEKFAGTSKPRPGE